MVKCGRKSYDGRTGRHGWRFFSFSRPQVFAKVGGGSGLGQWQGALSRGGEHCSRTWAQGGGDPPRGLQPKREKRWAGENRGWGEYSVKGGPGQTALINLSEGGWGGGEGGESSSLHGPGRRLQAGANRPSPPVGGGPICSDRGGRITTAQTKKTGKGVPPRPMRQRFCGWPGFREPCLGTVSFSKRSIRSTSRETEGTPRGHAIWYIVCFELVGGTGAPYFCGFWLGWGAPSMGSGQWAVRVVVNWGLWGGTNISKTTQPVFIAKWPWAGGFGFDRWE